MEILKYIFHAYTLLHMCISLYVLCTLGEIRHSRGRQKRTKSDY